ncbi:MAG: energy transducer TonB [Crocinitomicaceae bacterium]|nr:energy transducer TonB [Crocinitomicaceae bacterium]
MQLDNTRNIDRYLSGELSASDYAAFEEQLKTNVELQKEVELQTMIKEAAMRASFRADVQHAARRYKLNRIIKWGAAGLGAVALILATSLWITSSSKKESEKTQEAPVIALSMMEELSPNADFSSLPIQYFSVPKEGDVFLSDQSVLLSVPKKAFLLKNEVYTGEAIVQFQEALQANEIVKAGLNTKSGNDLLETQGMFSIHAYTPDGKKLEINPKVGVYVQVPVDEHKEGMQLYEYVDLGNGNGDWQNPKGLARIPVPVNMKDLDFYPEEYEDQLDKLKWKRGKSQRDSLYLSFENYCSFETNNTNTHGTSRSLLINDPAVPNSQPTVRTPINRNTMVVRFPDVEARFPGGAQAMKEFISATCIYPDEALGKGLSGRVYVSMEIDIYGLISNKKIDRSAHPILDAEALRIINEMPQWIPAQTRGYAVRSSIRLPIDFKLDDVREKRKGETGFEMMLRPAPKIKKKAPKSAVTPEELEVIPQDEPEQEDARQSLAAEGDADSTVADTPCSYERINPSKVLAFWKPEFNNTNLATREFERRMKAIHATCNEDVLKKYTSQLGKPISEIDRGVVNMGYSDFGSFAKEQVGAVNPNNPHLKNIKAFYDKGVTALQNQASKDKNWEQQLRNKWDQYLAELRTAHSIATKNQAEKSLKEETAYNEKRTVQKLGLKNQRRMNPVAAYPQFRKTIGFTARRSGGYNCDRPVNRVITYQAALRSSLDKETAQQRKIERKGVEVDVKSGTETRETFSVTANGRTRTIAYNSLSFAVSNPGKYNKIMAYAFPHQLESYQLLEGENGNFITSLNDDIIYDICIVGMTDEGYEYFQKQTLKGGSVGAIELKKISESKLDASLLQMNAKRNSKSTAFTSELDWIKAEKSYFKEVDRRQEMEEFRETIVRSIYPCYGYDGGESVEITAPEELPASIDSEQEAAAEINPFGI